MRTVWDKLFTTAAGLSVVLMTLALIVILAPMFYRGAAAVVFRGTVEFRRMQYEEPIFHRGSGEILKGELEQTHRARKPVYDLLDGFGSWLDAEALVDHARVLYRELKKQLRNREENGTMAGERVDELIVAARDLRDGLVEAYEAETNEGTREPLASVLGYEGRVDFRDTMGEEFFRLAEEYRKRIATVDIGQREQYAGEFADVRDMIQDIFGPRPGEPPEADLMRHRYGATRWDIAQKKLDELLWKDVWVDTADGRERTKTRIRRSTLFGGTELAGGFSLMESDFEKMMSPRRTFYWQYFIDDCAPNHYFGGVGPEIIGTLLLTLGAMLLAVPVGIATAAYLVECTRETLFIRTVRTCINTLAGVPSIVFGLFGLALFINWLPEHASWLGMKSQSNILAGALTLGVLVLPIIIRASEEAIRSVPRTYKEASLSLGAGGVRTFLTVTLPAALPGILTGVILSMSRAAGETAPILFTAAVASRTGIPDSVFEGGTRALSYSSYDIAVGDRVGMDVPHNQYGMIMTLILLVLLLNITAIIIRSRVSRKLRGG